MASVIRQLVDKECRSRTELVRAGGDLSRRRTCAVRKGTTRRTIGPGRDCTGFSRASALLAQTDAHRPAGHVIRHHLDCQPGGVGGETSRGEMVEADAVLQVAEAFSISAWRRWSASSSRVSPLTGVGMG